MQKIRNPYVVPVRARKGAGPHRSPNKNDVIRCKICNQIIDTGIYCDYCEPEEETNEEELDNWLEWKYGEY